MNERIKDLFSVVKKMISRNSEVKKSKSLLFINNLLIGFTYHHTVNRPTLPLSLNAIVLRLVYVEYKTNGTIVNTRG